jgi:DNA polymerase-1
LLIDGSSYIYRAFFALPPLTSPDGLPTNAVYGFTNMLLKLIREEQPRYLGVVFDAPGGTFRDDLFEAYKANRPHMPDDLAVQVPLVHEVVRALRARVLEERGVEADDVIASLTERFAAAAVDCIVITGDKDLMQLVGPHVRLWDTMRDRRTDEAGVRERLGVDPHQVVDVMALMGDSVDNIPGIKGIGEKTATALIQRFGSLDRLLEHVDEVEQSGLRNAKRIAALLRDGREAAQLSRELARVRRDVPLAVTLDDFRYDGPDPTVLRELFTRLGFQSLAREALPPVQAAAALLRVASSAAEVAALRAAARQAGRVAMTTLGTEPTDGQAPTARATALVLAVEGHDPVQVNLCDDDPRGELTHLLADDAIEIIAHDLKHDLLRLDPTLAIRGPTFDVMVASYLINPAAAHSLENLSAEILGEQLPPLRDSPEASAVGVARLPRLAAHLAERMSALEMGKLFRELEMPLVHVLTDMERRGVRLDVDALSAMSHEYAGRLDALMRDIYELAGQEFNINSPPQLRTVLFDKLGLSKKGVRRGKTGYSTDVDVLTRLAQAHPVPAKILEYRALSKLKSTYLDALPAAVNPRTGRLHTSFNQTVAVTGRLSSSDPNLQNIPARGEEGRRIRAAFVAEPGAVMVAADYSQIELRVLAHLSQDPALIDAFHGDADIHARTAAEMFGVLPGMVTPDMRRAAKVINFGIIYGMGPQRVAHELAIPLADAQRYIETYFNRYARVRHYLDETIVAARERGYVTTLCGRRRLLPDLHSRDRMVAQAAERTATNTPIQGSAADIIKLAMVALAGRLTHEGVRGWMILQVHDELVFEIAEADHERAEAIIRQEMEGVLPLSVPLRVDLGSGRHWAEAHA